MEDKDSNGVTPLMWAAYNNMNVEVVKLLLDSGASVEARARNGFTPLMFAAKNSNLKVTRTLLAAGAKSTTGIPRAAPP